MLYTNLGTILFYQGLYEEAIAPFRHAVELEEGAKDPLLWGNLGDTYRWVPGREEEARAAYRQGVALLREDVEERPGDLESCGRLVLYLARSGECEEALDLAPELERSGRVDSFYRLALTYEQCGERRRALGALEEALVAGYPLVRVEEEQELDRLRGDPEFSRIREMYGG